MLINLIGKQHVLQRQAVISTHNITVVNQRSLLHHLRTEQVTGLLITVMNTDSEATVHHTQTEYLSAFKDYASLVWHDPRD